jgi:hypothetical protein
LPANNQPVTAQQDHTDSAGRHRKFRVVLLVFAIAVAAMLTPFVAQVRRSRAANRLLESVDSLAHQIPPGRTADEWGVAVYWTHNLHCASVPQVYASHGEIVQLHARLETHIAEGADMPTVLWLWDEYAQLTNSGNRYAARYRRVMVQDCEALATGREPSYIYDSLPTRTPTIARP